MNNIAQPVQSLPFVDENRKLTNVSTLWAQQVTQLQILDGVGSPEGVVTALQKAIYMDMTGTAGNILWIKRDADIAGDRSQGWVLV